MRLRFFWLLMFATAIVLFGLSSIERPGEAIGAPPAAPNRRRQRSAAALVGSIDTAMDLARIRNFSIIAHIDHGKSTLSDRILEITGAVDAARHARAVPRLDGPRARAGHHDQGPERARRRGSGHTLHLIDTPGHVDFGYEVSRSLAACEGVVLVVDAAQGIEAQTLANCYLALEHDLEIVAALNKIDLPAADPDRYAAEIENVLGIAAEDILRISAKTGEGVPELLDAVDRAHPAARPATPTRRCRR